MPWEMETQTKLPHQVSGLQSCDVCIINKGVGVDTCLLLGGLQGLGLFALCFGGLGGVFFKTSFSWHGEEMITVLAKSAVCFASC